MCIARNSSLPLNSSPQCSVVINPFLFAACENWVLKCHYMYSKSTLGIGYRVLHCHISPCQGCPLTLPVLRLFSSKKRRKDFYKPFEPGHVGIHWIAFTEYSQMSTHVLRFQSFFRVFFYHFVLAKLATSSI